MTKSSRWTIFGIHVIAVICMLLGWFLPLLSIDIYAEVPILGRYYFMKETRSVVGTLEKLVENGNWLPALLIFLFGMLLPSAKALITFLILWKPGDSRRWMTRLMALGKWAMADVFAMGIFIAFLASNALDQTQAVFHEGFYYFTAFAILGVVVHGLMKPPSAGGNTI